MAEQAVVIKFRSAKYLENEYSAKYLENAYSGKYLQQSYSVQLPNVYFETIIINGFPYTFPYILS